MLIVNYAEYHKIALYAELSLPALTYKISAIPVKTCETYEWAQ
jgi:hypothetical protein